MADKKILVLLDDAYSAEQVRPLLPGAPSCFAVVTSRKQLSGLVLQEGAGVLALDVLSTNESVALLTPYMKDEDPKAAEELSGYCARLPLALAIAAARMTITPGLTAQMLCAELRDERTRLDAAADTSRSRTGPVQRIVLRLVLHRFVRLGADQAVDTAGHERLALLTGFVFFWAVLAVDPFPTEISLRRRRIMLALATTAHALFAAILLSTNRVIGSTCHLGFHGIPICWAVNDSAAPSRSASVWALYSSSRW